MKQQLTNSIYCNIGYTILVIIITGISYFAFKEGFCSIINWLLDTCESRASTSNDKKSILINFKI